MPSDAADRRVRSNAKSCAECRRRKIRCVWSSNGAGPGESERTACDYCLSRGRACVPQLQRPQDFSGARTTARDRISQLEREVASLAATVRERPAAPSSNLSHLYEGDNSILYDTLGDESSNAEVEDTRPPHHLRLLFDSFDMDHQEVGGTHSDRRPTRLLNGIMQVARSRLRPLIPSRDEVLRIAQYASDWMTLYHTLFPAFFAFRTGDQLVANYDRMRDYEVQPTALAMYLLSVAITAQQVPPESVPASFHKGQGVARYVDAVCQTVEHTIVGNTALAETPEGLETAMLYVRLSLGRGNLKATWLTLRRIIALAELAGLPQANDELSRIYNARDGNIRTQTDQEALKLKADVWEAICATDRNFSMMLNFPAGTARYRFPRDDSIWRDGQISPQAYNYQLSNICAAIFEIDESYVRGSSHAESYEKVLSADRQLRALAALAPKTWWQDSEDISLDHLLVKFWHCYIMARVHLRPGTMNDFDEQYAYSRTACRDACYNAVRRLPMLREKIPSGFFVCRVIDVQAFTTATFLLLSNRPTRQPQLPNTAVDSHTMDCVQSVIDCLDKVSDQAGSDLAREAKTALTSLLALFQDQDPNQSRSIRLQIPLLGKIHIRGLGASSASQGASVDLGIGTTDLEASRNSQDSNFCPEIAPGHLIGAQDSSSLAAGPMSWSFEFDDPSFWRQSSFILDNVVGIDY